MSEYYVRDNLYHEYDSRSPSSREAERNALDDKVNEFLRNGGTIQHVAQPTMPEIKANFVDPKRVISDQNRINAHKHLVGHNEAKELAIENGRKTFFGLPCRKCKGTERWANARGGCVSCVVGVRAAKTQAMHARKAARCADEKTYEGKPCSVCGCTTRNTATGACDKYYSHSVIRRAERAARKLEKLVDAPV